MKIEIFYFSGCPNRAPAVARVREVLQQEGTDADLVEVEVAEPAAAERVGFLGSPSIRVNGQDIEPAAREARGFGMMCRTYVDGDQRVGVPPPEWIRAALRAARGESRQ